MHFAGALTIIITCTWLCVAQFAGPGDITLERVEKCSDDLMGVNLTFKMYRANRTHFVIDAYLTVPFDFDQSVSANLTMAKWGDGGWKPNAIDMYGAYACEFMMTYVKKQFTQILILAEHPIECPLRKGTYKILKFFFGNALEIPMMYGKFRGDLLISKEGLVILCIRGYLNAEPRKSVFG